MRAADLIREMKGRGIQVQLSDGRLRCSGPSGAITEEIRQALIAHKAIIIAALSQSDHSFSAPIPHASRVGGPPLSFAQQRMWFLYQLEPDDVSYNIPGALRLIGDFDVRAFARAINEIVRRHESLRTTFSIEEGEAVQAIAEALEIAAPIIDLCKLPREQREAQARRLLNEEARRSFDLATGPLLRASILDLGISETTGESEHIVAFTLHHIVSDGWSRGVLIREFVALYEAFVTGRPSPLPGLTIQYADYAAWQRNWLQGEILERQLAYWREALAGAPTGIDLPTDRPRPAVQGRAGATYEFDLPKDLTEHLRSLGRKEGATLFMVLLAAFQLLLSRYSGQKDICVGTPVANRRRVELEGLIGFFANTLVLRGDLAGDPSFSTFLGRVRETALGAQAHQDLPFERLVEELQPVRDMSRSPLFQVMFVLQNAPTRELTLPGMRLEPLELESGTAKFDLILALAESDDGLSGSIEYQTALFDATTIARLALNFGVLLDGIVARPEARIGDLPILPEAERRRVLTEWNNGAAVFQKDRCLHELFEEQAARAPDTTAVEFEDERLTYGELNARANRLAHRLVARGIGAETVVGICVERSLEMIVGLLAILKAGGAYLPLDPDYPSERLAYMIEDAQPPLVVTQDHLRGRLPETVATLRLDADQSSSVSVGSSNLGARATPENLAYVIYTSGSTGKPKGVAVTHQNVRRLFAATETAFGLSAGDVWTLFHSYAFDFSVWEIWGALLYGGRLVIVPFWISRAPDVFHDFLNEHAVTVLNQTPSSFYQLDMIDSGRSAERLSSLRLVIFGGEALEPRRLADWFARHHDSPRLVNMYGITETTVHVTLRTLTPGDTDGASGSTVGRALTDLQTYLLDDHMNLVPTGVAGELYVGGAGLARGYLGRAALSAERFVPNPFGPAGERLYRSGDLARYRADGDIEYLGRIDHQVKIRGFRIELGEIEAALSRLTTVRDAVVVARDDASGDKRLVAYVAVKDGAEPAAAAMRAALGRDLPDYMIPSAFVFLDTLPLTRNGKVDRKALPAPDGDAQTELGYVAPRTPIEERLCLIWAEVLGLERVGAEDNFFELGGHSLLAVTLVERMRRRGLQTDVRTLFGSPTPAGLAEAVGRSARIVVPPNRIPPVCKAIRPEMLPLVELTQADIDRIVAAVPGGAPNVQDIYPLAPLQEGILFHHLLSEEGDAYLLSALLSFASRERFLGFVEALRALIARHDILRTAMAWEGLSEPVQVVWRDAPLIVEEVVLDPAGGGAAEQMCARFHRYRLDARRAPLARGFFTYDAVESRWLLTLLTHHLILDHTTLEILLGEIRAHLLGQVDDLPAPAPFRNFVAQARLGVSRAEHEAFFKEMLGDVSEPTAPFGLLDVRGDGSGVEEAGLDLDAELAHRLRERARMLGVSVASLFHQAFAQVLARVSGRSDVVFGTVLFGRMQAGEGADQALGIFINTLPLRFRPGLESVADSVRRMHGLLTELLRHEHASLALAQRCSAAPPPTPLFSALLNYRHSPARATTSGAASIAGEGVALLHSEERTNYPFSLSVDDLGDGFRVTAQVDPSVRPERVCLFMRVALEQLVEALETSPATEVRSLDVLPEAERRRVLIEWNDTASDYPKDRCIHQLFETQAAHAPDAIAVAFGGEQLTYGELNARANQLAHFLVARGVGAETVIGICVERSLETVVGLLGILKAGGAYLPLDPDYPRERLAYMIEDAQPDLVLTQERLGERLPETVRTLHLDANWSSIEPESRSNLDPRTAPQNLAYIIYTSGSTGSPKGVAVTHGGVVRLVKSTNYVRLDSSETVLHCAPLAFDASTFEIWGALLNGARLVLAPPGAPVSFDDLGHVVRNQGVTTLWLTASLFHYLTDFRLGAFAGVKQLLTGGDVVSPPHARAFREAFPSSSLVNGYGPTENTTFSTFYVFSEPSGQNAIPIGKPIANSRVYILGRDFEPAPIGVAGELYAGGDGLARGYLGRPDLTAERFVPDPFGDTGERLYRTGDVARYRMDGNIEFLGRVDHQVKIRGFRIELGEIEAALARMREVREAIVILREDVPGDKRLVAYVAARDKMIPTVAELRAALGRDLPDYMVPSTFVFLDALPLTANGKVDRKALPAPDAGARTRDDYDAPRTVIEWVLAREFEQTLQIWPVGIHDNFFQLGGNSLSGVKLVERMRGALCSDLPVTAIFQAPTIARLSDWISSEKNRELLPLVLMRRGRDVSPLYCIHPGGGSITCYQELAASLAGASPVYGIQSRSMFDPSYQDDSIEEMAIYYVDEIRRKQPRGPYYLLGWSMGGFIAVAMAARLEQLGATVAFLGILDTQFVDEEAAGRQATALDCLERFAAIEGRDIDSLLSEADRDHLRQISAELPSDRERYVYAALWGQERGFWRNISAELMNFIYSDRENALRMIRDLRLPRINASMHVWWATETLALTEDVPIDWRASTRGAVRTEVVGGNHEQIVRDPRVHAQLQLILQSVRDGRMDADAENVPCAGSNLEPAERP